MPGNAATLDACTHTFSSIRDTRISLPKITTGTRIAPVGWMTQLQSVRRVSLESSIASQERHERLRTQFLSIVSKSTWSDFSQGRFNHHQNHGARDQAVRAAPVR